MPSCKNAASKIICLIKQRGSKSAFRFPRFSDDREILIQIARVWICFTNLFASLINKDQFICTQIGNHATQLRMLSYRTKLHMDITKVIPTTFDILKRFFDGFVVGFVTKLVDLWSCDREYISWTEPILDFWRPYAKPYRPMGGGGGDRCSLESARETVSLLRLAMLSTRFFHLEQVTLWHSCYIVWQIFT